MPCHTKELKESTCCPNFPNPESIDSALEFALNSRGMDTGDLRLSFGVWCQDLAVDSLSFVG